MVDWASKMQLGKQIAVDVTVEIRDYGRDLQESQRDCGRAGEYLGHWRTFSKLDQLGNGAT